MECSSMFFPIQVKQEVQDDGYEVNSHANSPSYFSPPPGHHFLPPHAIKTEPNLSDLHSSQSPNCISPLPHGPPSTVDGRAITVSGGGSPPPPSSHNSVYPNSESVIMKPKKKKKKKHEEPIIIPQGIATPDLSVNIGKKLIKQEKITDTFKVRKKVDRFNGMPEEEVVKRTLPDHLADDLDIVIIGINPGLYAAFKGHHYAGPGNHFWKCLYLSGLIPEPMTADDDFRLIEYGIGFTNIVARTTRGSADLARKEIREGAQILQEKLQKFKPKIAVFNGKGIYEVYSGRKNFDFGKQPEPIEGTSTLIYVMPSSSARCAQLPRAVDKVPFYVALKKLRDHLCGRLPVLRDSEVCFPDVKLKMEAEEGIRPEGADDDGVPGDHIHNQTHIDEDAYRRQPIPHAQRNFHQHPLGRAALAAAAACGGYLEETLARANMAAPSHKPVLAKHPSSEPMMDPLPKKKNKKRKKRDELMCHNSSGETHHLLQNMKCEPDAGSMEPHPPGSVPNHNGGIPLNGTDSSSSRNSPNAASQRSSSAGAAASDYSSSSGQSSMQQSIQRPSPHPHPLGNYGSTAFGSQLSPSPGAELHSPYGSPVGNVGPYHHPHIKQEKVDLIDGGRLTSPSPGSPSLLPGYPSSVGCLYNGPPSTAAGYGPPGPQSSPYFGGPTPSNPYGGYHSALGPPPHLAPHLSLAPPHHNSALQNADLFALSSSPSSSSVRENGLHGQHRQSMHHHQAVPMSQHETQYYGHNVTTSSAAGARASPYSPTAHKDSPTAFHHYQSPASYHPNLHHLQPVAPTHQYCPDGSLGVYNTQPAPLYANLETVKIKQERLDPSYDNY